MARYILTDELRALISDLDLIPAVLVTKTYENELLQRRLDQSLSDLEKEILDCRLEALSKRNHSRSNSRIKNYDLCVPIPSLFDNMV